MKMTRREFVKSTLTAGTTAIVGNGAIKTKSGELKYGLGESPMSVKPLQERNFFGVELSHRDFAHNTIRYRIPECWFCGLPPVWPPPGAKLEGEQSPNVRYPFTVLGPFSFDPSLHWKQAPEGLWFGEIELAGWWSCQPTEF